VALNSQLEKFHIEIEFETVENHRALLMAVNLFRHRSSEGLMSFSIFHPTQRFNYLLILNYQTHELLSTSLSKLKNELFTPSFVCAFNSVTEGEQKKSQEKFFHRSQSNHDVGRGKNSKMVNRKSWVYEIWKRHSSKSGAMDFFPAEFSTLAFIRCRLLFVD
jgi:hypothetical protein